jgi:cellulose synthase/poly-beta-1,6-N-acetylglucosamine synthase-like glycosyltransferase/short-subunit dehydrogenase
MMLATCIQGFLAVLVVFFLLLVALEGYAVRRRAVRRGCPQIPTALPDDALPVVSVFLPVYNERHVVEKLIDAVCALDYPADKLDILLLDDSTDATSGIAAARIAYHQSRGVPVRHARRESRIGYKAGNLNYGLTLAKGDFVAIFDADCLPPPDFLRKVMPCFADSRVGFLQTGVSYGNADSSFLTRFQAMEAGHKEEVTSGFFRDGFMASLTGSSCVWRRCCISAIGGISADTITEDVDMGYRAQLGDWKYVFLPQVVSRAELPETAAAFRVQRQRWAHGLIHNALRHAREVFSAPMPLAARLHAVSLVFSSLLLAGIYALLLCCLPFLLCADAPGGFFHLCCTLFLLGALLWAWFSTAPAPGAAGQGSEPYWRLLRDMAGYLVLFFPVSLYYFYAATQVFCGVGTAFHRTPKGSGRRPRRQPPINRALVCLEILSLLYALATFIAAIALRQYWVALYCGLAVAGFGLMLSFSRADSQKTSRPQLRHVLITGATGALGGALAREYAAPGMRLTLHGRRTDALEQVAAQCREQGARVDTFTLDLRDRETLRRTVTELCRESVPDLVIANAGRNTNIGPDGAGEPFPEVEALVEVNLLSSMALVDAVLPAMRKRGSGQIAIVSSLAACYGLPTVPAYCAAKSALRTWGMSLRGWLHGEGIRVNVILPGYVKSPMCDAMPGPKPFLWQPERAARTIRRGLERDWARISFPFPLNLGIWGLALLPACLSMPIARLFGYGR